MYTRTYKHRTWGGGDFRKEYTLPPGGIAESNIRRTFTVRFPNLYCVWQRCRDIRGSYRNVLLLIVLRAEGSGHADGGRRTRTESRQRETTRTTDEETAQKERERKRETKKSEKGYTRKRKRERDDGGGRKERKGKRTIREHSVRWCF